MKNQKKILLSISAFAALLMISAFTNGDSKCAPARELLTNEAKHGSINMVVSHGHCSTPFSGKVEDLELTIIPRADLGNPLEEMSLRFDIDPNSFAACSGEEVTSRVKNPELFIGPNQEKMRFKSTEVFTMGIDWYQINGILSIKGVEHNVQFFASGVRDAQDAMATDLIVSGKVNLLDWGIDYDKIVSGKSDPHPTKWMYFNMQLELDKEV